MNQYWILSFGLCPGLEQQSPNCTGPFSWGWIEKAICFEPSALTPQRQFACIPSPGLETTVQTKLTRNAGKSQRNGFRSL